MKGLAVLLRKEMLEQWRTYKMLIVGAIFLVFGLASPLLARYTPELLEQFAGEVQITLPAPTVGDAVDQLLKNLGQMAPLAAILIAMGAIANETSRGTAALVLTKPATRFAFLAAKFLAVFVTLAVGIALAGVAAYFYTSILFEPLPVLGFAAGCLLLFLSIAAYGAVTLLGSALVRSSLAAAGMGLAAFILTAILSIVPTLAKVLPMGLYAPAKALALGQTTDNLLRPLLLSLAVVLASLGGAWVVYRKKRL